MSHLTPEQISNIVAAGVTLALAIATWLNRKASDRSANRAADHAIEAGGHADRAERAAEEAKP